MTLCTRLGGLPEHLHANSSALSNDIQCRHRRYVCLHVSQCILFCVDISALAKSSADQECRSADPDSVECSKHTRDPPFGGNPFPCVPCCLTRLSRTDAQPLLRDIVRRAEAETSACAHAHTHTHTHRDRHTDRDRQKLAPVQLHDSLPLLRRRHAERHPQELRLSATRTAADPAGFASFIHVLVALFQDFRVAHACLEACKVSKVLNRCSHRW